ncbi:MAG: radical SAM protein, partial [Pirellulaceae bacterium]
QLEKVEGIDWIRLMYLYPQYLDDALLDTIADTDRILPYIDLPLQHINDRMLKRMARQVTRREVEDLLARMRARVPGLSIRTTMITGFPGETESEFAELHAFVKEQEFERLGVFTYSFEPNTPSASLPDHLPDDVKSSRRDLIMATQQEIMLKHNSAHIGESLPVILDSRIRDEQNVWVGRSMADAPEVDSLVYVTGNKVALTAGRIASVEVVAAQDYDLIGIATGDVY